MSSGESSPDCEPESIAMAARKAGASFESGRMMVPANRASAWAVRISPASASNIGPRCLSRVSESSSW